MRKISAKRQAMLDAQGVQLHGSTFQRKHQPAKSGRQREAREKARKGPRYRDVDLAVATLDQRDRDALKVKTPFCEVCGLPATELHHVRGKNAHPEYRHDPRNHCALCAFCHVPLAHSKHRRRFDKWFIGHRPKDSEAIGHAAYIAMREGVSL